jgi:hypothetical protein
LPTREKKCRKIQISSKSRIANISLYKQQSRADSNGRGATQDAAYRRSWWLQAGCYLSEIKSEENFLFWPEKSHEIVGALISP